MIMPYRSGYGCKYPGCAAIISDGRYCALHAKEEQSAYNKQRGSSTKQGYGGNWRKLRKMYLAANPICADPSHRHPQQIIEATQVDHSVPRSEGGTDDWDNLEGLCISCHSYKTAIEDGRWGKIGRAHV